MRAISMWQPWALLWLLSDPDEKVFETRSRYWSYRGPLLVHAAKKKDGEVKDFIDSHGFYLALERHGLTYDDVHFGAIIGRVEIIGSCQIDRMPEPSDREQSWGNWSPDRFAHERAPKPVIFKTPIPYRGQQGWFDVPNEILGKAGVL